jgi:hypothetical protein
MPEHLYDDTYTGPRWVYGCAARPPLWGGAPDGQIIFAHRGSTKFAHGTIEYPFALTDSTVDRFGLVFIETKEGIQ